MITLEMVQAHLRIEGTSILSNAPAAQGSLSVRLFSEESAAASDGTPAMSHPCAWLCQARELPSLVERLGSGEIVAWGDPADVPKGVSCLFVPPDAISFLALFQRLQDAYEHYAHGFFFALADSAMREWDVERLLEIAQPFFSNPLYVCDSAFQVLACTRQAPISNPTRQWKSITANGWLDPDITRMIRVAEIDRLDALKTASFHETVDAPGILNLVSHIERDGKRIANLTIIGSETPFDDHHLPLADYLTECIQSVLDATFNRHRESGALYERWLLLLMDGTLTERDPIEPHLSNLGWAADDTYQVVTIDFMDKKESGTNNLDYYWRLISSALNGHKCFIYEGSIVALLHLGSASELTAPVLRMLERIVQNNELRCTFSLPFSPIFQAHSHHEQAQRIRRCAASERPIVRYEDVMVDDLLDSAPFAKDWRANVCPEALRLEAYDVQNGTEMVRTLHEYLSADRSIIECARRMKVHRNTILYRIEKMRDAFGLDLESPEKRLALLLSCRILQRSGVASR